MTRLTSETCHRKSTGLKLILVVVCGVIMGYFIGSFFARISMTKINLPRLDLYAWEDKYPENVNSALSAQFFLKSQLESGLSLEIPSSSPSSKQRDNNKIYVPTNPHGAEALPPGIIESFSDLYLHKLMGIPSEDLQRKPKYLLAMTVGLLQKDIINTIISKFSENFSFVLFHYDGRTSEWDQFEWSQRAIHISARKQTKWWFAKRFLHPDILAPYEYVFIWDEDLGVEHFIAEEYIKLIREYDLEISQPGVEPFDITPWMMTRRREGLEVHKETERPGWCHDPHLPPCVG